MTTENLYELEELSLEEMEALVGSPKQYWEECKKHNIDPNIMDVGEVWYRVPEQYRYELRRGQFTLVSLYCLCDVA